jgi:hypothetical protein
MLDKNGIPVYIGRPEKEDKKDKKKGKKDEEGK